MWCSSRLQGCKTPTFSGGLRCFYAFEDSRHLLEGIVDVQGDAQRLQTAFVYAAGSNSVVLSEKVLQLVFGHLFDPEGDDGAMFARLTGRQHLCSELVQACHQSYCQSVVSTLHPLEIEVEQKPHGLT